jgi:hypothetical protein
MVISRETKTDNPFVDQTRPNKQTRPLTHRRLFYKIDKPLCIIETKQYSSFVTKERTEATFKMMTSSFSALSTDVLRHHTKVASKANRIELMDDCLEHCNDGTAARKSETKVFDLTYLEIHSTNDPIVVGTSSFSCGRTIMDHPTRTQTSHFLYL